jgi:hypothetical protein
MLPDGGPPIALLDSTPDFRKKDVGIKVIDAGVALNAQTSSAMARHSCDPGPGVRGSRHGVMRDTSWTARVDQRGES